MYEDFIIQGIMSGVLVCNEFSLADEGDARREARKLLNDATFEGDSVRIITRDGELVWDSNSEKLS
jgi:hypothetical protein